MGDRVPVRVLAAAVVAGVLAVAATGFGGRAVGLPPGFPADVPLPADALVRSVRDLGPKGFSLVVETGAGLPGALETFRGAMLAAGWSVAAETAVDGAAFLSFRKGERSIAVGASAPAGATQLGLSVVERPFNEWGGGSG